MVKLDRTKAEKDMKDFLQKMSSFRSIKEEGYKYTSPDDLLLKVGSVMGGKETEPDKDLVELVVRTGHHEIQQCYKNCAMLSIYADWNYCEGYVVRAGLGVAISHAWLELDGFVYDPTIREGGTAGEDDIGARLMDSNERNFYYGVKLDKIVVHAKLLHREESFSVLQDWKVGFPVLKENSPWLLK